MSGILSERPGGPDRRAWRPAIPSRSAALLPRLHLVQAELGWIPAEAEAEVAGLLGLPPIEVREAVTFYSMFRRRPSGRHHLQVCRNLSCTLRGSEAVLERLKVRLGIESRPDHHRTGASR